MKERVASEDGRWQAYTRALAIFDGKAPGHALPVIRRLAHRGFAPAVTILSDYVSDTAAIRMLRRAAKSGDATCAYNLAITYRNRGDMLNYRRALASAAQLDSEAAAELRKFKTRFPEAVMSRFGRKASRY